MVGPVTYIGTHGRIVWHKDLKYLPNRISNIFKLVRIYGKIVTVDNHAYDDKNKRLGGREENVEGETGESGIFSNFICHH